MYERVCICMYVYVDVWMYACLCVCKCVLSNLIHLTTVRKNNKGKHYVPCTSANSKGPASRTSLLWVGV